eukprot:4862348-Amphidinium_carterae.1
MASTPAAPDALVMPEVGLQSLAPTFDTESQIAVSQAEESKMSTTMTIISGDVQLPLSAPGVGKVSQTAASHADANEFSSFGSLVSYSKLPLPVPEVTAGVEVFVASKRYEIGEKLGRGAGGSVHRASPRCEAADIGGRLGQGGGPDS